MICPPPQTTMQCNCQSMQGEEPVLRHSLTLSRGQGPRNPCPTVHLQGCGAQLIPMLYRMRTSSCERDHSPTSEDRSLEPRRWGWHSLASGLSSWAWPFLVLQCLYPRFALVCGHRTHFPPLSTYRFSLKFPSGSLLRRQTPVLGLEVPDKDIPSITTTKIPFPNYITSSRWTLHPIPFLV